MARDYAKVLQSLPAEFKVIGRGARSAEEFSAAADCAVRAGGLQSALKAWSAPDSAIVAVGVEELARVATNLIEAGTRRILLEKPGGLNTVEIQALEQTAVAHGATVLIAYNRRFHAATARARELIAEDGGATICTFEFTEWSHLIAPLVKASGVKDAWFLANSTHVVDLAFHLCGFPKEWSAWHGGSLSWHPASARFCGAGVTEHGVFFSYHADWEAPGRWGVEVLTRCRRFVFRPMEQLQVIPLGSVKIESVEIDDHLDKAFKPGLYEQTSAFVAGDDRFFCTLADQARHSGVYDEMAGYNMVEPGRP